MRSAPLILASTLIAGFASADQLALTPPMGWNSWNHFGAQVSDAVIRAQADAMVGSGMRSTSTTPGKASAMRKVSFTPTRSSRT